MTVRNSTASGLRRLRPGAVLGPLAAALLVASCSDDCSRDADCSTGERCTAQGTCLPFPSVGIDFSLVPGGRGDGGRIPGDGGMPGDAGMPGDGGAPDQGDAGGTDVPRQGRGLVSLLAVRRPGAGLAQNLAEVRFWDETDADVRRRVTSLPDVSTGNCSLIERLPPSGTVLGELGLDRVEADFTPGVDLRFEPRSAGGALELTAPGALPEPLFDPEPGQQVRFSLDEDPADPRSLRSLSGVTLDVPPLFLPQMPAVNRIFPSRGLQVTWQSVAGPQVRFLLELYDAERTVVLRCEDRINLGSFTLPGAAGEAFFDAGPLGDLTLDVGFVDEEIRTVETADGGQAEVRFRLLQGARYDDVAP